MFGAAWQRTHYFSDAPTEVNAYATKNIAGSWLQVPMLVENQTPFCEDISISASANGFRSIWTQANLSDPVDTISDRIWVSAEY